MERYFKNAGVSSLMVLTAAFAVVLLPSIWLSRPNVVTIAAVDAVALAASGVLYMGAIFFYLQALKVEEASVAAPFFQAAPLFGYILGYLILGERLSLPQDFGGLMIVGGTALLSIRSDKRWPAVKLRLTILMLTCALSMSVGSLIFKIFAASDEFWTATFWSFVGQASFGIALTASAVTRKQLGDVICSAAPGCWPSAASTSW